MSDKEKNPTLVTVVDDAVLTERAQKFKEAEESMSLGATFRAYKKALAWSVLVSMNIVMESYGTILLNSFYAQPAFLAKFGEVGHSGKLEIPAKWQTSMSLASSVGIIIGIWLNGLVVDRWGYKKIMVASLIALSGFVALPFAATSKGMIVAGMLLCGLPWGTLNVIAPAYAVEVLPPAIRHYGPTYVNQCWVIGHLIGAGVQTGLLSNHGQWGWRIPFALQWMWPVPLIIGALLCPESPWWLVRHGRTADAVHSMKRLASSAIDHEEAVALIEHTVRLERDLDFGSTYSDMVRGVDRRRTEIGTVALSSQALVGFIVQGYQTYFFKQAGMPTTDSFKLTLGTYGIAFVGTALSMPLQDRFGRRTLWLAGMAWMLCTMVPVGILACVHQTQSVMWAEGIILMVWFGGYGWSVGPLAFVIASEVGSAQLRAKTIAVARGMQYLITIANTVVAPYVLNSDQANLKGKAAFIPAGFTVVLIVWSYFRLPETKGRSFDELDVLFAKRVPARKFRDYVVTIEDEMPASAKAVEDQP
ncbi:hypothetical protein CcaverHIS002_0605670 [Cutaneotrichosporon cavernicola]|uniref:Major facilitator superfamily (MFS) profile domain-containing protein n=1 Tax=Cutaneotrichosporon cavernicola TaxID=279322 RepID=A0AA48L8P7_9TREE|nr:uncharacterized protein CcaverHIS019_0605130 [Cutaneotrichosporon cavernicola]BEI86280.1 hypothetical protein CcaverHIS002_0605670 [Cutaneotrichosporon cavernicola]BEI94054.1 hypothetical protein CcaverHIS019_0605130 [Cutaneotrichosporon cavernicola]BEJ01833.1 hypothetical protein CcaverHIS631_0605150 [Cutaneotrichosporon cavernicola]BEJ09598.1 hypothetical protein CcaverHIS641_0605130 [Cutaneotrichosporon cavernicola]